MGAIYQIEDNISDEVSKAQMFGDLDPRGEADTKKVEASDDLTFVILDDDKPEQVVKIGAHLPAELKDQLGAFLREHKDVFAWTHADMPIIDPEIITHSMCF